MKIGKIIYKNRYEINKIFNILRLKGYEVYFVNIKVYITKRKKIYNFENLQYYNKFFIDIDNVHIKYEIKTYNNDLFLVKLYENYIFNNIIEPNSDYINNKNFINLLKYILKEIK